MTQNNFFTAEEKMQITDLYKQLYTVSKEVLLPNDDQKVRYYIREAIEKGLLQRDTFNLNPIINDCETALIVAEEISMNRPSILGVMLSGVVLSGAASVEEIKADFGEDVANILHGMFRASATSMPRVQPSKARTSAASWLPLPRTCALSLS